jgi:hypothetical protein
MSALGQKRTFAAHNGMSALPPKADIQAISPRISDEHGSARQNNLDFGELARLRIDLD